MAVNQNDNVGWHWNIQKNATKVSSNFKCLEPLKHIYYPLGFIVESSVNTCTVILFFNCIKLSLDDQEEPLKSGNYSELSEKESHAKCIQIISY